MTRTTNWTLFGLHLLLALSLPVILIFMVGCKQARPSKEDLGPAVPEQTVLNALYKAQDGINFNHIRVGQYVDVITERQILDQETTVTLGEDLVQVIDKDKTAPKYTLLITKNDRNADGSFTKVVSQQMLNVGENLMGTLKARAMTLSTDPTQVVKTTYHHLQQSDGYMDPPDKVKARSDCGGLTPCQLKVHYVQFDMVLWYNSTDYQKISIDLAVSAQTPYLPYGNDIFSLLNGALVTNCQSTFVPVDGHNIYVRDCSSLNDFQL